MILKEKFYATPLEESQKEAILERVERVMNPIDIDAKIDIESYAEVNVEKMYKLASKLKESRRRAVETSKEYLEMLYILFNGVKQKFDYRHRDMMSYEQGVVEMLRLRANQAVLNYKIDVYPERKEILYDYLRQQIDLEDTFWSKD